MCQALVWVLLLKRECDSILAFRKLSLNRKVVLYTQFCMTQNDECTRDLGCLLQRGLMASGEKMGMKDKARLIERVMCDVDSVFISGRIRLSTGCWFLFLREVSGTSE